MWCSRAGEYCAKDEQCGHQVREVERGEVYKFREENSRGGRKASKCQGSSAADSESNVALQKQLDDLLEKQEAYWYMRSHVAELRDGDKNTKYFHHKASERKTRNYIAGLFDRGGVRQTEEADVENVFYDYYDTLFTTCHPSQAGMDEVLSSLSPVISFDKF